MPVIYGCGNCLITRRVFASLGDPSFDLRFNFLGGGDTDFFVRCRRAGMKFHWAAEAVITETVPSSRTNPGWLALRALRIGAINYHVQRKLARTPWSRARLLAKMLVLLPLSLVRAAGLFLSGHKALIAAASGDRRGRQRAGGDRHRTATLQSLEDRVLSQLVTTSELRAVVGELRRRQVMDVVRGAAFIGALLLAWISLRPFVDLGNQQLKDTTTGNETLTYLAFGGMAVLTVALAMRDNMRGLATLFTPGYILFGGWIVVTVVLSLDPGTSIKRFALTACVIAVAATLPLLPKSQSELMRWFSISALVLLAVCYLGILLVPHLSIHLATDIQEPQLAGNWRGAFGHKNVAASVMAMLVFLGIYVVRSGAWLSGAAIIALASLFLLYSAGKSSLMLTFVVLALTSLTTVVRACWLRVVMLLAPLVLLDPARRRHGHERRACRNRKNAAAGFELHRPHRHLDLRVAGAAAAAADGLRL